MKKNRLIFFAVLYKKIVIKARVGVCRVFFCCLCLSYIKGGIELNIQQQDSKWKKQQQYYYMYLVDYYFSWNKKKRETKRKRASRSLACCLLLYYLSSPSEIQCSRKLLSLFFIFIYIITSRNTRLRWVTCHPRRGETQKFHLIFFFFAIIVM